MNVEDAIQRISFLEGKISLYNEVLDVCNDVAEGRIEDISQALKQNMVGVLEEIRKELDSKKIEAQEEIQILRNVEVKIVKAKSRGRPKGRAPRPKKTN